MSEPNSGRPPAEAFYTVTDPEQARLLVKPVSFEFFRPFLAQEKSVKGAATELNVPLDTMLYRVKTMLRAGLIHVSRLEKRAGRPIKHYRSVHEAYIVPFEVTPFADTEERLKDYFAKWAALVAPRMAQILQQQGREGRRIYRNPDNLEVWSESAGGVLPTFNLYDAASYESYMAAYKGSLAEFMDGTLELSDADARAFMTELYGVWRRYERKKSAAAGRPYFFQFTLVPETS